MLRLIGLMLAVVALADPAHADKLLRLQAPDGVPFNRTLSNTYPFAFGMTADEVARALGTQLFYVNGKPGEEILLAIRHIGGGGFFPRDDQLFLQFRKSRLTGFKADWGRNWMWR